MKALAGIIQFINYQAHRSYSKLARALDWWACLLAKDCKKMKYIKLTKRKRAKVDIKNLERVEK